MARWSSGGRTVVGDHRCVAKQPNDEWAFGLLRVEAAEDWRGPARRVPVLSAATPMDYQSMPATRFTVNARIPVE